MARSAIELITQNFSIDFSQGAHELAGYILTCICDLGIDVPSARFILHTRPPRLPASILGVPAAMGHGHAFYALVLKLFLVLMLTPVALCEDFGSSHSQPGSSSSSSGTSSSQSLSSSLASSAVTNVSAQTTPVMDHTHRSRSSTSDTSSSSSSSTSDSAVTLAGETTTALFSPPLDPPPETATSPPTDPSVSPAGDSPPAPSSSSANEVLGASAKSNPRVPIIAGVVAPVVLIALVVVAWLFYRRHQRVRDRREWERTHASIADAVRQVASPGPIGRLTPGAQWGRMDLVSRTGTYSDGEDTHRSGDTITNPFVDSPVAHQHAGYDARPPIQALHSPTFAPQYSGPFDEVDDDEYAPQAR